jgi:hypothetical protein
MAAVALFIPTLASVGARFDRSGAWTARLAALACLCAILPSTAMVVLPLARNPSAELCSAIAVGVAVLIAAIILLNRARGWNKTVVRYAAIAVVAAVPFVGVYYEETRAEHRRSASREAALQADEPKLIALIDSLTRGGAARIGYAGSIPPYLLIGAGRSNEVRWIPADRAMDDAESAWTTLSHGERVRSAERWKNNLLSFHPDYLVIHSTMDSSGAVFFPEEVAWAETMGGSAKIVDSSVHFRIFSLQTAMN